MKIVQKVYGMQGLFHRSLSPLRGSLCSCCHGLLIQFPCGWELREEQTDLPSCLSIFTWDDGMVTDALYQIKHFSPSRGFGSENPWGKNDVCHSDILSRYYGGYTKPAPLLQLPIGQLQREDPRTPLRSPEFLWLQSLLILACSNSVGLSGPWRITPLPAFFFLFLFFAQVRTLFTPLTASGRKPKFNQWLPRAPWAPGGIAGRWIRTRIWHSVHLAFHGRATRSWPQKATNNISSGRP